MKLPQRKKMDKNILRYFSNVTGEFELTKQHQRKLMLKDINYLRKIRDIKKLEKARYMEKLKKIYSETSTNLE